MTDVSVIMPVYNAMPYLKEAVTSILNQTLGDFRFIIVNDASTDRSGEYLRGLKDERVEIISFSKNQGPGAARNFALGRCQTEFVVQMDADDVAFRIRLQAQLDYLRAHEDVGMVGTQFVYLGPSGRMGFSPPLALEHEKICAHLLQGRHALCNPTLMCRTEILKGVGGYKVGGYGDDWDMFLRMGEVSRLANLNHFHLAYRLHAGSSNATNLDSMREQYAYACHCARLRAEGQEEIGFEEFLALHRERPPWRRIVWTADNYASAQYRLAVSDILGACGVRGFLRLGWSAICSPPRTRQYLARALERRWRIGGKGAIAPAASSNKRISFE